MTYKWNLVEAENYAKNFSDLICGEFFKEKQMITGGDILKLTEIRQLNLMIVKSLYEKWQEESERLKSPFFDYENVEVKKAFGEFMNILSRYISVKQDNFQPALQRAVKSTLQMNMDTAGHFEDMMRNLPDFKLTSEWLSSNGKYYSSHSWVLKELLDRLNGLPFVYANQAIDWVRDIFTNAKANSNTDLAVFDKIMSLQAFGEQTPNTQTNASFFDLPFELTPEPAQRVPLEVIEKPIAVEPERRPEVVEERHYEIKQDTLEKETIAAKSAENKNAFSLNDKMSGAAATLNDKITMDGGSSSTLLDKHAKGKIDSIRSAISLNQRFLFINNLFGGDVQTFSTALNELEACQNFATAKEQMVKVYLPKYKWDISSAEAEEFFDILKRKFN